ncbi:hypothetical protein Tco_0595591 [Tanacetum coccineum]
MRFVCHYCFGKRSVSKFISWRGDHVVAAMDGFRYPFHTRWPEPPYKRVLPLIADVKGICYSIVAFYIDGACVQNVVDSMAPALLRDKNQTFTNESLYIASLSGRALKHRWISTLTKMVKSGYQSMIVSTSSATVDGKSSLSSIAGRMYSLWHPKVMKFEDLKEHESEFAVKVCFNLYM